MSISKLILPTALLDGRIDWSVVSLDSMLCRGMACSAYVVPVISTLIGAELLAGSVSPLNGSGTEIRPSPPSTRWSIRTRRTFQLTLVQ